MAVDDVTNGNYLPNFTDEDYQFLYEATDAKKLGYDSVESYKNSFSRKIQNPSKDTDAQKYEEIYDAIKSQLEKVLSGDHTLEELNSTLAQIHSLAAHSDKYMTWKDDTLVYATDDVISKKIAEIIKAQAEKENIPEEEKEKLKEAAEQIEDKTLNVDEHLPQAAQEDDGWKKEVREAVEKANVFFKEKNRDFSPFQDTPDPDHPNHLFFKDAKNNTIAFASKEQAYVEGEQAAFDELVVSAQNLGKTKINFGKFEKHPEYKAMLYLACLKHGMEMKNAPELGELKQYPEYKEIRNIRKKELLKKLPEIKTKSASDTTSDSMVPATRELFNTFSAARETYGNEANAENKKALIIAREALETQYPELRTNRLSKEKTIRELAQIYKEELSEARQNHNEKKDQPSKDAYRNILKEATEFYIENGSGKPNDWSTPYERHQKIEKHISAKEDGTIERKDNSEKTETLQKFALERQIVQTVLQNRR